MFDTPVLSYVERLTTNGPFALSLSKGDGLGHRIRDPKALGYCPCHSVWFRGKVETGSSHDLQGSRRKR